MDRFSCDPAGLPGGVKEKEIIRAEYVHPLEKVQHVLERSS